MVGTVVGTVADTVIGDPIETVGSVVQFVCTGDAVGLGMRFGERERDRERERERERERDRFISRLGGGERDRSRWYLG